MNYRNLYRVIAGDDPPRGYKLGILAKSIREAITLAEQAWPGMTVTSVRLEYQSAFLVLGDIDD